MSDGVKGKLWFLAALAVLLAGILMTLQEVRHLAAVSRRLTRKHGEMARLQQLAGEVARGEETIREFGALSDRRPGSLRGLLDRTFPGSKAQDVRESVRESVPGWIVRQVEIAFSEAGIAEVAAFVAAAEAQRPPWRLARCLVNSSPHTPGAAQVVLQLETAEKQE